MSIFELMEKKKKKTLNKFVPLFFPVHSRKGDIGEGGVEKEDKDNCIGRNRQVVSFRLEGMELFSNKTRIFIIIFPLHVASPLPGHPATSGLLGRNPGGPRKAVQTLSPEWTQSAGVARHAGTPRSDQAPAPRAAPGCPIPRMGETEAVVAPSSGAVCNGR